MIAAARRPFFYPCRRTPRRTRNLFPRSRDTPCWTDANPWSRCHDRRDNEMRPSSACADTARCRRTARTDRGPTPRPPCRNHRRVNSAPRPSPDRLHTVTPPARSRGPPASRPATNADRPAYPPRQPTPPAPTGAQIGRRHPAAPPARSPDHAHPRVFSCHEQHRIADGRNGDSEWGRATSTIRRTQDNRRHR